MAYSQNGGGAQDEKRNEEAELDLDLLKGTHSFLCWEQCFYLFVKRDRAAGWIVEH